MKKILDYILTVLILLVSSNIALSQDSTYVRGIRFGCDISRFTLPFIQPGRKAVEFSVDTEWKPKYFPTAELGFENINLKNDYISYKSNAIYTRIGYDKNILKNDNKRYADMFFVGYRYGFSLLHHEVTSYTLNDGNKGLFYESLPAKTLQTHWLEFVVGTRAAITNAIFLGFSLRTHLKIYSQKDVIYPYIIPGFGKGEKKLTIGLNYSLYFQIPVMKVSYKKK